MWSEERRTGEEERTGDVYVSIVGLGASTHTPTSLTSTAATSTSAKRTEIRLVKLQLRTDSEEEMGTGMLCISGDLCPVSGRAAIHWETPEGRSNVTLYDV
jgi:hypothetical protein